MVNKILNRVNFYHALLFGFDTIPLNLLYTLKFFRKYFNNEMFALGGCLRFLFWGFKEGWEKPVLFLCPF
jgi:hypothetical protein